MRNKIRAQNPSNEIELQGKYVENLTCSAWDEPSEFSNAPQWLALCHAICPECSCQCDCLLVVRFLDLCFGNWALLAWRVREDLRTLLSIRLGEGVYSRHRGITATIPKALWLIRTTDLVELVFLREIGTSNNMECAWVYLVFPKVARRCQLGGKVFNGSESSRENARGEHCMQILLDTVWYNPSDQTLWKIICITHDGCYH